MKIQHLEDGERVFPTLGITVSKNDFYEIPDDTTKTKNSFKADAKDGDKDGLVQDGTEHERPVSYTQDQSNKESE